MPPKASQHGAQIHTKSNKNTDVLLVLFSIRLCINFGINVDLGVWILSFAFSIIILHNTLDAIAISLKVGGAEPRS